MMKKIIAGIVLLGIVVTTPIEAKDSITWEDVKGVLGSKEAQGVYIMLGAITAIIGLRYAWVYRQKIKNFVKTIGKASQAQAHARMLHTILSSNKNEQERLNDLADFFQEDKDGVRCYVEEGSIRVAAKEGQITPNLDHFYRVLVAYKGLYNKNNTIKRIYINDVLENVGIVWP